MVRKAYENYNPRDHWDPISLKQRQNYPYNWPKIVLSNNTICYYYDFEATLINTRDGNKNHQISQVGFSHSPQVDQDLMDLGDHVLAICKYTFSKLPLGRILPVIIDYRLHMLVQNMIMYHVFLMWEPHRISFDFTTALMSLYGRGL